VKPAGNAILVTGGTGGIGLALAGRFLEAGNEVAVCGRDPGRLRAALAARPGLRGLACDVAQPGERRRLAEWAVRELPGLNVLVNNAGVQREADLASGDQPWERTREEIAVNLEAPIDLSMLLAPRLAARTPAAILAVSSGLAFAPMARTPVYCATKAALHSFCLSLRSQLAGRGVEVVEIIPPAVDTDLGGPGRHRFGVPVEVFAGAVMEGLARGEAEIGYGSSARIMRMARGELDAVFAGINGH